MKRRQLAAATVGVAVVAAGAGAVWQWRRSGGQQTQEPTVIGSASPGGLPASHPNAASRGQTAGLADWWSTQLLRPDGTPLRVATYRDKPLIVNFWATWCPPCIREMPLLDRFYRAQSQAGAKGWQLIGLAVDHAQPVQDFLRRHPVAYDIGVAGLDALQWARLWGNDKGGLPFTVAFAADGRIVQRKLGELQEGELERW